MADFVDPFAEQSEPQQPAFVDPFDTSTDQGALKAGARGVGQGLSFGFGDELRGLQEAGGAKPGEAAHAGQTLLGAYKYFTGDQGAVDRYNTAVARARKLNQTAEQQHPYAYGAGDFAGSVGAMAAMPEAELASVASPLFRGVLKGAQVGSEYGALSGAGEADDGSRLSGAGIGAAEGLIGGAAAPVITAGIGKVARPIANTVMGAINPERQAAKGVAAALDADQELIRQGKVKGMSQADWMRAKAAGEPVTLADLGGPNTQSLLRSAANASPEARGKIEKIIGDRFEGQSQRVAADVRNLVNGGADAWKTGDQLVADYDAKRTPLYVNAFMQHNAQAVWDDTLEQITQAPSVQNAIRIANVTARNDAARRGMTPMRGSPFVFDDAGRMTLRTDEDGNHTLIPNLQYWDSVKKALDKAGSPEAQQWARILRDHLDTIVPEYGAARGFAANYFGESNALQAGRKLAGKQVDPEIIRRTMAKMDPEERNLFREGYASDWADRVILNYRDTRDVTKAMFNSPNELARAEAVFGPQGVQALKTRMDLERIMDGARQAMGNSTTARQLIEAGLAGAGGAGLGYGIGSMFGEEGHGGMGALAGAGLGLHRPGENPLARHAARMLMTGAQAGAQRVSQFVDRGTASRVADLLMSNDPDKRRLGLAAAMKDRRISNALSQLANRLMLAGGLNAGRQFKRGGAANFHQARYRFIKKQGGGELSDEDQAAMMPETFVNPAVKGLISGAAQQVATPGKLMQPNPYPAGSEEADWYDRQRQEIGEDWARNMALNTMGTGAIAGVPVKGGEVALGAGAVRGTKTAKAAEAATEAPFNPQMLEDQYGPVGTHPAEQALTVNDILHPDTPALPARSRNVEEIAQQLNQRGAAALRGLGVKESQIAGSSPRSDELISRALASEVKGAIERGGNTAQDWYTKAIDEAMQHAATIHPELAGDPIQKMGFTASLAVTSQGETVASNVRLAEQAYDFFKKNGRFPTDIKAKTGPAMNANFAKLNKLLDEVGPEGTRDFLHNQFTVKELQQAGHDVGGENVGTQVYGSSILGPKIGQGFYQNLNGNYDPVTMDLWFMRGWGRLTGTLVGRPAVMEKATQRLTDAMREEGMKVPRNPDKLAQMADDTVATHERDFINNRAAYDSGEKSKSELTLASERYLKNLRGINEQPTSGSQREWMRSRVNRAREILAGQGHNLTNADLQAIWWYPEKELYSKLGGRDSEAINTDYASVYRNLAAKRAAGQP